jgi:Putative porin
MKRNQKQNTRKNVALFAGATALMAFTPQIHAQTSVDALLNKLEQKGILTVDEAKELKTENQEDSAADLNKAMNSRFPMPDWVTSYKLYGDFRGRFDVETTDSPGNSTTGLSGQSRQRLRYRLRVGMLVNMKDDMQVGFRLGSGDSNGNDDSNNTTMENNATKKPIWVDAAYGKWTPLNDGVWMLAATFGKMDQPFVVSPMVFDPDYTPEGGALQSSYKINDSQSVAVNGAGFVLDEAPGSSRDPYLVGGQALWNASWTSRVSSSMGFAAYDIINKDGLGLSYPALPAGSPNYNPGGVPNNNQGNTRNTANGNLLYYYNPIVGSASFTYTLDSFPLYKGKFPVKPAGEFMYNPAAPDNNQGWWAGVTLGKAGKKGTWDVSYRYQYLEADAWYDEVVDDDNVAFYANGSTIQPKTGWVGGTNVKGHLIKFDYSFTDSLNFAFTAYINQLINPNQNIGTAGEPKNNAMHIMADLMWKF